MSSMVWKKLIIPSATLACLLWSGCDSQSGDSMVYPEIGVTFVEMKTFGSETMSKTEAGSGFAPQTRWDVRLEVASSAQPDVVLESLAKQGDNTAAGSEVTFSVGLLPAEDYLFRVSFLESGGQQPVYQGSAEFYIDERVGQVDIPVVVTPTTGKVGSIAFIPGNVRGKVGSTISVDLMYFGATLFSSGLAIEFEPEGISAEELIPLFVSEGEGYKASYDGSDGSNKLGLAWIWTAAQIGTQKLATLNIPTTSASAFSLKVTDGDIRASDNQGNVARNITAPETAISVQVIQ